MLVLIIGALALVIAYILSHLVFSTQVSGKRRLVFFVMSICSFYVAMGSIVFMMH